MDIMQGGRVVTTHVLGQAKAAPPIPVGPEPRTRVGKVGAMVRSSLVSRPIEPGVATTATAAVITGGDLRVFDEWLWDWGVEAPVFGVRAHDAGAEAEDRGEAQLRHEVVAVTGDGVSESAHTLRCRHSYAPV